MNINQTTLIKLQQFCAYKERCHSEVRTKLIKMEIYGDKLDNIMSQLIQDDFLNEERYARAYVRGKYRMNNWGKKKIMINLKSKQVSEYCIKKGLEEIDQEEYYTNLLNLLEKQMRQYARKNLNTWQLKSKLYQFAAGKGYESEVISMALEDVL